MPRTQFKANQVRDFNAGWYLDKYQDIGNAFDDWAGQQPMNFAAYVRGTPDLETEWNRLNNKRIAEAPYLAKRGIVRPAESRVHFGTHHWNLWGSPDAPGEPERGRAGAENRDMAYSVGDDYYIMSKDLANDQSAKDAFAAWHFDTSGRNEPNRYGTEKAFYDSPGETKKRDDARDERLRIEQDKRDEDERIFNQGLEDARVAAQLKIAEGAEYSRLASRRGGGSQTLGASGAATFKGKGLKSSENKRGRGRGTGQLRRPYGASNLSIAAGTGAGQRQGTGLNRAGLG